MSPTIPSSRPGVDQPKSEHGSAPVRSHDVLLAGGSTPSKDAASMSRRVIASDLRPSLSNVDTIGPTPCQKEPLER